METCPAKRRSNVKPAPAQPVRLDRARPGQTASEHGLTASLLDLLPRTPPRSDLSAGPGRRRERSGDRERVELVLTTLGGRQPSGFEQRLLAFIVEARQMA